MIAALERRAARAHIAGPVLEDALAACRDYASRGFATSLGFWDRGDESPHRVAAACLAAVDALAAAGLDCCLCVKAPSLGLGLGLFAEVLRRAELGGVAVQLDALGPETADMSLARIPSERAAPTALGCTLPGRWVRSLRDADRLRDRSLTLRVVKGQWPDPEEPDLEPRRGFLAVVDRLAGRSGLVRVATHDAPLGEESLRRLKAAGTPCEWELLLGLPSAAPLRGARRAGIPARFYVPYGHAHLPYRVRDGLRDPRVAWWLARDLFRGLKRGAAPSGTRNPSDPCRPRPDTGAVPAAGSPPR